MQVHSIVNFCGFERSILDQKCVFFYLDRFTLQRNISSVSQTSTEPDDSNQGDDDRPVVSKASGRLSAKQRRYVTRKETSRPNPHRTRDGTRNAMQANGTC